MNKFELILFGMVSILALAILLIAGNNITGKLVLYDWEWEEFDLGEGLVPEVEQPLRPADSLTPDFVTLEVNRVPIYNNMRFVPLRKDRINVFTGSAGYYATDPAGKIQGKLCAYAYKIQNAPWRCETVPLDYSNGKVTFARAYAPDEHIGRQAAGTDFAAVFIISHPTIGILAQSPTARLRWTTD